MSAQHKQYLGDSVYAAWDGYHIVLTTEDGIRATNMICLDAQVILAFERYCGWLSEQLALQQKPEPE